MQLKQNRSSRKYRRWIAVVARLVLAAITLFVVSSLVVVVTANAERPVIYDVPLDENLQIYIADLCEEHHIDPAIVIGIIQRESNFDEDIIGDNGNSYGLMQIQPRWHGERMARLECSDLLDPFQNVKVGVDILAELIETYGDMNRALMVYNAGAAGAYDAWFQYGIYSNDYSTGVQANANALTVKEGGEDEMSVPDNYDVWFEHEQQTEQQIERLPVCVHCENPIQQETAVCLDGDFWCDECLELNRVEVVVE